MSSIQLSNSVSASLYQSETTAYSSSSSGSGSRQVSYLQSSETMLSMSAESNISINSDNLSISSSAELSLKFSHTTQLAVDGHVQGNLNGTNSHDLMGSLLSSGSVQSSQNDNSYSLFKKDALSQQIYEDNLALFDDFLANNGNELTKENVRKFVDLMKDTIPKGFNQARSRLSAQEGLPAGDQDALVSVQETVMDKLEQFEDAMIQGIENGKWQSPDDLSYSNLPGVKSSGNPLLGDSSLGFGTRVQLSVQFQQTTAMAIEGQTLGQLNTGSGESGTNSTNNQYNGFQINVDALSQTVFQSNLSVFNNYVGEGNQNLSDQNIEDFVELMKDSLPEGFRQARERLSQIGAIDSNEMSELDKTLDQVLEELESFKEALVSALENGSESTAESSTNSKSTETSNDNDQENSNGSTVGSGEAPEEMVSEEPDNVGSDEYDNEDDDSNENELASDDSGPSTDDENREEYDRYDQEGRPEFGRGPRGRIPEVARENAADESVIA